VGGEEEKVASRNIDH